MRRLDSFEATAALLLGTMILSVCLSACVRVAGIGNPALTEIHPKPGVTCFTLYNNSVSCLKD